MNVLIIEDEQPASARLKKMLKEVEPEAVVLDEIVSIKSAVEWFRTHTHPDLILMDYFLDSSFGPSKDGLESLAKLKEICPDTNVIMLTSVDNKKIVDLAIKKGALDYVIKGNKGFDDLDAALKKYFSVKN